MNKLILRGLPAAICVLAACPISAQVVINEVLYDPEGSDTGLEFVELLNCGRQGVLLAGWVLETGNGANPDDWTVEWIGGDLDYVEPGETFVVGEVDVLPPPDYATPLDLQNGPDGVRLTDGDEPVDVVGWGEPLFQEYYEGSPADDVPSGTSLARSPDCFDHDDNAADFVAAAPTPGSANSLEHDLCLVVRHPGRAIFESGGPVELEGTVGNIGALPTDGRALVVELLVDGAESPAASLTITEDLAPRDSTDFRLSWSSPTDGYHRGTVSLGYAVDGAPSNNTARTSFTVGGVGGLVAVNEIMHSPDEVGTEWIELIGLAVGRVSLAGWSVGDEEDACPLEVGPGAPDSSAHVSLGEGDYLLVARDAELLEGLASCPVVETDGWEALSADDTVVLADEFGTPMDRVTYERSWGGERGVSLERVRPDMSSRDAGNWGGSVAPEGSTPGRTNSIHLGAAPASGRLTAAPNPFTPNGDGDADRVVFRIELPVARATARLTVFDIEGRPRAVLADHAALSSETELLWDGAASDGSPLPSGLYIVYLEAIDARAGVFVTAKTAVGIVR
jgi:hypothetical protein